jgi:hypothetical protein
MDNPSSSPSPLCFSDAQLDQIFRACVPLNPSERTAFLEDLASALGQAPHPLGDGAIYRTIREVQRRHFNPPDIDGPGTLSKWQR